MKYIKYMILLLGAAALTAGLIMGDAFTVFQKAAAICLECIGIG